jgi:hypothetical protein
VDSEFSAPFQLLIKNERIHDGNNRPGQQNRNH